MRAAVAHAVDAENARWSKLGNVNAEVKLVGSRPAGVTPENTALVQTALAVSKALGFEHRLRAGSTDANAPMHLRIPAVTIGGGGAGTGAHSLEETFDTTGSFKGTQYALLLALALVE